MNLANLEKKVAVLHNRYEKLDDWKVKSEIMSDIHDLKLRIKKDRCNINFRLTGDNKYYMANQCDLFRKYILKHGIDNKTPEQVKEMGLSFNRYSINLSHSQYGYDIKRFNSVDEMLGFVIGFNFANSNI